MVEVNTNENLNFILDDQVVRYAGSENRLHKLKFQSTTF